MEDESREGASAEPVVDRGFRGLLERLSGTYYFDFREYKEASLARRVRMRMSQVHVSTFEAYAQYLDQHPQEHVALFNTILINVTGFFRDPNAWAVLSEQVLPRIVTEAGQSRSIRMWSAGCSSGEEPYTLAMLLAERLGDRGHDYMIKIYGTDIDEEVLTTARHAAYRLDQLKDVPDNLVDRYFTRDGQLYRLRRELRRWCIFGSHNMTQAPPLSHIDLLVCRNVLIYFSGELQERVLARFHYAIRPGGTLFLGRSESLLARSRLFTPIDLKWRIFERSHAVPHQASAVLPDRGVEAMATERDTRGPAVPASTRLQQAVEVLPASIIVVDMADTVVIWNSAAEQLFEIPISSAVARKFRDIDVSYRVEGLRARIEEVKIRRTAARMEDVTFARRNGEIVHVDVSLRPIMDGDRPGGIVVFMQEATEHARLKDQMGRVAEQHATAIEELQSTNEELETTNEELQSTNEELETTVEELQATNSELAALNNVLEQRTEELRRLDLRHHAVLNSLEEGLVIMDRSGIVQAWNHAAEGIWGLPQDQVVGRPLLGLLSLSDAAAATRAAYERVLQTGQPQGLSNVPYVVSGRESRQAHIRLAPLTDAEGQVTGVIGVLTPANSGGGARPDAPSP